MAKGEEGGGGQERGRERFREREGGGRRERERKGQLEGRGGGEGREMQRLTFSTGCQRVD